MKVRQTIIDDSSSSKPTYPDRKKKTEYLQGSRPSDDLDDENEESEEDEDDMLIKRMIYLTQFDMTINIYGIETIVKGRRFVEKPSAHFEHGIVINKGMEPSMRFPNVDIEAWFLDEEYRDIQYQSLLEKLEENGFKVILI